jgi:hypothetical protein
MFKVRAVITKLTMLTEEEYKAKKVLRSIQAGHGSGAEGEERRSRMTVKQLQEEIARTMEQKDGALEVFLGHSSPKG